MCEKFRTVSSSEVSAKSRKLDWTIVSDGIVESALQGFVDVCLESRKGRKVRTRVKLHR